MSGYQNSPPDPYRHYPPPGYGPPPGYPSAPPPPQSPYEGYPPQLPPGYPYAPTQSQVYQGYFNGGGYPPPPPQQLPPYQVYQYDEHHHHCHDHHDNGSSFLQGWRETTKVLGAFTGVWLPFVAAVCLKNAATKLQWTSCLNIWDPVILSGVLDV
ncbi:hypothetical protein AgCh_030636 [Apium graveolens]